MAQNQLSPLVRQDQFPLFDHSGGGLGSEFARFVTRVLTDKIPYSPGFADSVFRETAGHPYLTVNVLVDLCEWLIARRTSTEALRLEAEDWTAFAKERLAQPALKRSLHYRFFHHMLSEYLGERSRSREPWLHAVATILRRLALEHPKSMTCGLQKFREIAADGAELVGTTPDALLAHAAMANFLESSGGEVRPAIRLMARLAGAVTPKVD